MDRAPQERVIKMADEKIIGINTNQEYLQKAVDSFTAWWKIDRRIYDDCIKNSIKTTNTLPSWYLMLKDQNIIGGYGLVRNDFISRQDLCPWICALYIEEGCRGSQLGSKLLEHAQAEASKLGYKKLYLSTDQEGYYEKYGWKFVAKGYHPWEAESMIYEIDTEADSKELKFAGNPTLETSRLILRTLQTGDAKELFEYAKKPNVTRYLTWEPHNSISDTLEYIKMVSDKIKNDQAGEWGIQLKETGEIIGSIGFVLYDQNGSCGELGYVIDDKYWGQGIMTEAIRRVIQFAFENIGLQRVEAVHYPENPASGKAMQKAGMLYEGLLRSKTFAKDKYWDLKMYAITRNDYIS